MPAPVLIVVHSKSSNPGRVGAALMEAGHPLDIRCPMLGHALPQHLDGHAGVVVFGGPMSANDDHEPGIRVELDWLPTALEGGKPVLGICLGAQLIARALGARVAPHPDGLVEMGYTEVRATAQGAGYLPPTVQIYQWHSEGFSLPAGAVRLATNDTFPEQAFRYDGAVFGVQFHPEVRKETVALWTTVAGHHLERPGAQAAKEQLAAAEHNDPATDEWVPRFLRAVLAQDDS